jgi:hypothetical protein
MRQRQRRWRRMMAAAAKEEKEVSLGVIMTNTEIFHIFPIINTKIRGRNQEVSL